jgi:hypothetical protein
LSTVPSSSAWRRCCARRRSVDEAAGTLAVCRRWESTFRHGKAFAL